MLVNYMIEKYKEDVIATINSVTDDTELRQLWALLSMLECNEFVIESMTREFDIEKAPELVYLFDLQRNMFWKEENTYGYTKDIFAAGIYNLERAIEIVMDDCNGNTKIVYFSK